MNARSQVFELRVETRQVQEAVLALFHSVLFHRTFPKYNFQVKFQAIVVEPLFEPPSLVAREKGFFFQVSQCIGT